MPGRTSDTIGKCIIGSIIGGVAGALVGIVTPIPTVLTITTGSVFGCSMMVLKDETKK